MFPTRKYKLLEALVLEKVLDRGFGWGLILTTVKI
jgi:hypothetical protein